jgi:anti-sigma factor RsiW
MTEMDHIEALWLQAAEKYVLGELPNSQREEYEEHYFNCADCAEDIKAAVALVEGFRQVFRELSED